MLFAHGGVFLLRGGEHDTSHYVLRAPLVIFECLHSLSFQAFERRSDLLGALGQPKHLRRVVPAIAFRKDPLPQRRRLEFGKANRLRGLCNEEHILRSAQTKTKRR